VLRCALVHRAQCQWVGRAHAHAGAKLGQAVGRAHAAQAEVEPGQAGPHACRASGPRRHCAAGCAWIRPSDS
jgi:hypothetical protein